MLTGYFMRELEYATVEEALHIERLLKIGSTTFSLGSLDDGECLKRFRFTKSDISRIISILHWPPQLNTTKRRRYRTNAVLSFCILSRRLGTVCRLWDLEMEFGLMAPVLNEIFYEALEYIYSTFSKLLSSYRQDFIVNSDAIHSAGAPLDNCVGT